MTETNHRWLRKLLTGEPHMIIGSAEAPYLLRWYLIPRNPRINVYLHKFLRDDDDRALHDHPWWFASLILRGGYIEIGETADGKMTAKCRTSLFDVRSPFWKRCVAYRPATWRHRVTLPHGTNETGMPDRTVPRVPCWTLIITGPRSRSWGFWCRDRRRAERFVPWQEFGDGGCGEAN